MLLRRRSLTISGCSRRGGSRAAPNVVGAAREPPLRCRDWRGPFGPRAGARFGLLTCGGDENNGTVRLAAAVATNPRNPVRSAGLTVHFIRCRGHELRNLADF